MQSLLIIDVHNALKAPVYPIAQRLARCVLELRVDEERRRQLRNWRRHATG